MPVDHGPGHAADDGQADGAADLLAGVEHAGSDTGVLVGYPGDQGHGERDEDQPAVGGEDDQRQADAGQVVAVLTDAGSQNIPAGASRAPVVMGTRAPRRGTSLEQMPANTMKAPTNGR